METLQTLFNDIFSTGELVRMIFSGKRKKSLACTKVTVFSGIIRLFSLLCSRVGMPFVAGFVVILGFSGFAA